MESTRETPIYRTGFKCIASRHIHILLYIVCLSAVAGSSCVFHVHPHTRLLTGSIEATHVVSGGPRCKSLCERQKYTCVAANLVYSGDAGLVCDLFDSIPDPLIDQLQEDFNAMLYIRKGVWQNVLDPTGSSCSASSTYGPRVCETLMDSSVSTFWRRANDQQDMGSWVQFHFVLSQVGRISLDHRCYTSWTYTPQCSTYGLSFDNGQVVNLARACTVRDYVDAPCSVRQFEHYEVTPVVTSSMRITCVDLLCPTAYEWGLRDVMVWAIKQ